MLEQLPEVVGQRRFELQLPAVHGMAEHQPMCVQRLACKRNRAQPLGTKNVAPFPDQRVPTQSRLNSDLVSLAGFETHFDKRRIAELLDDRIAAHRLGALRVARVCSLLDERLAIPDEVIAPGAFRRMGMPVDEREVNPFRVSLNELLLERLLRSRILGEHNQTGRIAIDSMHDEWSSPLWAKVPFQLVVHRWCCAPGRERDGKQTCRLVNHQQNAVFKKDVERRGAAAPWRPTGVRVLFQVSLPRRAAAPIRQSEPRSRCS